jgi:selenide,water dikinase
MDDADARARGSGDVPRLTALSPAAGCAAKLGMDELDERVVATFAALAAGGRPDLVSSDAAAVTMQPSSSVTAASDDVTVLGIGDDAAVVRVGAESVVTTTDFFPPIVDDARTWGHVAATNAIGDVHAMGARPVGALVLLGWPAARLRDELTATLAGLHAGAAADGIAVQGGHSIASEVPFVGLSVLGLLDGPPLRQDALAVGDALVLTAPVGTGLATTAARRAPRAATAAGGPLQEVLAAAVAVMTRSLGPAAAVARACGLRAATDVTGFGLLGHLHRMARASGVDVRLDAGVVPLLPGVLGLVEEGAVSGGSRRNGQAVVAAAGVATDPVTLAVLADAQTAGGLLVGCPADGVDRLVTDLVAAGDVAAVVGEVVATGSGRIDVVGSVRPSG